MGDVYKHNTHHCQAPHGINIAEACSVDAGPFQKAPSWSIEFMGALIQVEHDHPAVAQMQVLGALALPPGGSYGRHR